MKILLLLVVFLAAALASEDKYTDKYDKLNVDEILNSVRLLGSYFDCLMDMGSCTPEGNELKKVVPEALTNECAKCTQIQKETVEKVIKFLSKQKPEMWEALEKKYDPESKYQKKYGQLAQEHDIDV